MPDDRRLGKPRKPGNVREFNSCRRNVMEVTKRQGNFRKVLGENVFRENYLWLCSRFGLHQCLVNRPPPVACFNDFAVY